MHWDFASGGQGLSFFWFDTKKCSWRQFVISMSLPWHHYTTLQIGLKNYDPQRNKHFSGTVKYVLASSTRICRLISVHPTRLSNPPCPRMSIWIFANVSGLSLSFLLTLNPDIVIVSCLINPPLFSSNQTSVSTHVHIKQMRKDLLKWVVKCWLSIRQERPFNELDGLGSWRNQQ